MKSRFCIIAVLWMGLAIFLLATPGPVWALREGASDLMETNKHTHHEDHPSQIPKTVNFALLVGLLYYFLNKPAKTFFNDRADHIAHEFEVAAHDRKVAEETHKAMLARIASAEQEFRLIREAGEVETKTAVKAIMDKVEKDIAHHTAMMERRVDAETNLAFQELRRFVLDLACEQASHELVQTFTPANQGAFLQKFSLQ